MVLPSQEENENDEEEWGIRRRRLSSEEEKKKKNNLTGASACHNGMVIGNCSGRAQAPPLLSRQCQQQQQLRHQVPSLRASTSRTVAMQGKNDDEEEDRRTRKNERVGGKAAGLKKTKMYITKN